MERALKKPPTAIYLSSSVLPSRSANSVHVMKMCQALSEQGCRVVLIADAGPDTLGTLHAAYQVDDTFKILTPPASRLLPYAARHVWRAIFAFFVLCLERARGNFTQESFVHARDILSASGARILRVPITVEVHDLPARSQHRFSRNSVRYYLLRSLLSDRCCLGVVAISRALECDVRAEFPMRPRASVVLHDGADAIENSRARAKQRMGKHDANSVAQGCPEPAVGYVGSMGEGRGVELILELARSMPHTAFHMIGGSDEERSRFQALSSANVLWHGFLAQDQLPAAYEQFTIALAPYESKVVDASGNDTGRWMSPLKIFEYMAHGKAIVASDLPTIREVLDNSSAVLVTPGDRKAWTQELYAVLNAPLRSAELGVHARQELERNYTWAARARRLLDFVSSSKAIAGTR